VVVVGAGGDKIIIIIIIKTPLIELRRILRRALGTYGRDEKCTKRLVGNPEGMRPVGRRGRIFVICV